MRKMLLFSVVSLFLLFACDGNNESVETSASFVVSPSEAPVGTMISFNAAASAGAITSFEWDFGDGLFGSGQVTQHAYSSAAVFTVRLTVRDSSGGVKNSSKTVDIYREGMKMTLHKTYFEQTSNPCIWFSYIYSQDIKNKTVWVVYCESNFNNHSARSYAFWLSFTGDLIEYVSNENYPNDIWAFFELLASSSPRYLFNKKSAFYDCFTTKGSPVQLFQFKLKSFGAGRIGLEEAAGRDCWSGRKFDVEMFPADFEIALSKYYDE